jgi:translation initiation factor 1
MRGSLAGSRTTASYNTRHAPFVSRRCALTDRYAENGMGDSNARIIYSTGGGSRCPGCGWPLDNCQCSGRSGRDEPVPTRIVAKLRVEKSGRGGKTVTVVYDLPRNQAFLRDVAGELKRACGTGGTVVDNSVELQGDVRERVRPLLARKGWTIKG